MYPGATGCNTIPNCEDVAHAAARGAHRPSNPKSDYETKPVRPFFSTKARNGKPNSDGAHSRSPATQVQPHATLCCQPHATRSRIAQPGVATQVPQPFRFRNGAEHRPKPTPLFPMGTASFVLFRTPPESASRTHKSAQSRPTAHNRRKPPAPRTQHPAPARFARPTPLHFAEIFVTIVYRTPLPKAG